MNKKYNPAIHNRSTIRMKGYDYSQPGLYFITICCHDKKHLFGKIIDGQMVLNNAGQIAQKCWLEIPKHFPNVILHEFVIMPNHVHGIIEFTPTVGAKYFSPDNDDDTAKHFLPDNDNDISKNISTKINDNSGAKNISPLPKSPSKTVGSVVRGFKIGVTKWMRKNTDVYDVWQRNYYENIIRNAQSYQRISKYIENNPAKWKDDRFYGKH